jgi:hypothetical protein
MTSTANNLRAALKQAGFNARMVTVKDLCTAAHNSFYEECTVMQSALS